MHHSNSSGKSAAAEMDRNGVEKTEGEKIKKRKEGQGRNKGRGGNWREGGWRVKGGEETERARLRPNDLEIPSQGYNIYTGKKTLCVFDSRKGGGGEEMPMFGLPLSAKCKAVYIRTKKAFIEAF